MQTHSECTKLFSRNPELGRILDPNLHTLALNMIMIHYEMRNGKFKASRIQKMLSFPSPISCRKSSPSTEPPVIALP